MTRFYREPPNMPIPTVGSRWLRTAAEVRGKGLHVVVCEIEKATIGERTFHVVRYQQEGKARTHTMPARAFIAPSAHVPADAAAVPPPLPPLHRERLHALLDEIEASVKEARGLLSGAA